MASEISRAPDDIPLETINVDPIDTESNNVRQPMLPNDTENNNVSQPMLSNNNGDPEWKPSVQVKLIIAGLCFVMVVIGLDITVLTVTLPTVAEALHADATKAFWFAAIFLLTNAIIQPLMAAWADIFGRQAVYFSAVLLFTIGSVVASTAQNVAAMMAGRAIQGLGSGGILSLQLIVLSDIIPLRHFPRYYGQCQIAAGLGTCLAPVVGGALVKSTWRWLFFINFPFCAVGLAIPLVLFRYKRPETTIYHKLSSIDWVGSTIFILGTSAFLIGASWGGNQYLWDSVPTLVPLLVGLATVAIAALYERFGASTPFMRLSVFTSVSMRLCCICAVLQALVMMALLYYTALFMVSVKLHDPLFAGTALLAFTLMVLPGSGITGAIIAKTGRYRWAILAGWTLVTIGCGVLVTLDQETSPTAWVLMLMCAGGGSGMVMNAQLVAAQASCHTKDIAYASSMFSFFRSVGMTFGVALGGSIFQNFLRQRLAHLHLPTDIAANAVGYVQVLKQMSDPHMKATIIEAYAWAFQNLFATLAGMSGLGLLLSLGIVSHSLDVKLAPEHQLLMRDDDSKEQVAS